MHRRELRFSEVSISYNAIEDRIRGLVNMNLPLPKGGFWFTRRLVLDFLRDSGRSPASAAMEVSARAGGKPAGAGNRRAAGNGDDAGKEAGADVQVRQQPLQQIPLELDLLLTSVTVRTGKNAAGKPRREIIMSGEGGSLTGSLSETEFQAFLDILALRVHESGWIEQGKGPDIGNISALVAVH